MADGATVANAFVQVMPSMQNATSNISAAIMPSISAAGTKAGGMFGSFFNTGAGAMLKKAGAAAIGYLAFDHLRDTFASVETGFNNVIKATGATGDAANELKNVYINVSKSVVGSFDEMGAAVGELNTRLGLTGDDLEAAATAMLKYSRITGQDAVKATQDVASMMRSVGIPTSELATTLDKLTVAGQAAGIDVSNLANNITKYNAVMKQLGLTTDEQIALMAKFEVSGADTASILSAMKKGVAEWAREGKDARTEFMRFVKGVQDGSVTAGDAVELFGTKGGLSMYEAAQKGQLSFEDMFEAISQNSDGALDTVYNTTLTAQEKFDLLGQRVNLGFYQILEPIVDAVSPAMDDIIEVVSGMVDFVVTYVVPAINGAITYIKAAIDIFKKFFDAAGKTINNITKSIGAAWDWLKGAAGQAWDNINATIQRDITDAQTVATEATSALTSFMSGDFDAASEHAAKAFDTIKKNIDDKITAARDVVGGAADVIGEKLGFPGLGDTVRGIFDGIRAFIEDPIGTAKKAVEDAANKIGEALGFPDLAATVDGIFKDVQRFMEDPIGAARDFIEGIPGEIVGFFSGLGERITSAIGSILFPTPHYSYSSPEGDVPMTLPVVTWWATGGFFDKPTLFGAGEAGSELLLPREGQLMDEFADEVASHSDFEAVMERFEGHLGRIIYNNVPTISRREFDRMARGALA